MAYKGVLFPKQETYFSDSNFSQEVKHNVQYSCVKIGETLQLRQIKDRSSRHHISSPEMEAVNHSKERCVVRQGP